MFQGHCIPKHDNWKQGTYIISPVLWIRNLGSAKPGLLQGCDWDVSKGCNHLQAHLGGSTSKLTHEPLWGLSHNTAAGISHSEQSKRKLERAQDKSQSFYNLISEVIFHHLAIFCLLEVSYWVHLMPKRRFHKGIKVGRQGSVGPS